jgi:hypothetical protein
VLNTNKEVETYDEGSKDDIMSQEEKVEDINSRSPTLSKNFTET